MTRTTPTMSYLVAIERSDFKGAPGYANSDLTTFPATSVRRKSRPW